MNSPEQTGDGAPDVHGMAHPHRLRAALRGISRNGAFLIGGQIASRAIGFIYILVLAHFLGLEEFGQYQLVISLLMVAITAAEFGFGRMIVRDLARDPSLAPRYMRTVLPMRLAIAVVVYLLLLGAAWAAGYSERIVFLCAIGAVGLLPTSIALLYDAAFHAGQHMRYSAGGDVVLVSANFLIGSAVLWFGGGVVSVLVVGLAAATVYLFYMSMRARTLGYMAKPTTPSLRPSMLFRGALPFAVATLIGVLASRAELLLLGALASAQDVGLYGAAVKFTEAATVIAVVLGSAAAPVFAQTHSSRQNLGAVYFWTVQWLLWFALGVALVGVLAGPGLMALFFPAEFAPAAPVLQWLFAVFPLQALYMLNLVALSMADRARALLFITALSAIAQFAIGMILIGRYGLWGAAYAALASQAVGVVLSYACLQRYYISLEGALARLAPPLLGALTGLAIIAALPQPWTLVSAIIGGAGYALAFALIHRFLPGAPRPAVSQS